jgi:hypothetical protein
MGINEAKLVGSFKSNGSVNMGIFESFMPKEGLLSYLSKSTSINIEFKEDNILDFSYGGLIGIPANILMGNQSKNIKYKIDGNKILTESTFMVDKYSTWIEIIDHDNSYDKLTVKYPLGETFELIRVN